MKFLAPRIIPFISGMARQADKPYSAVARSILKATPEQFVHARRLLELSGRIFRFIGLRKVAVSLLHPMWRLPMLALTVHFVCFSSRGSANWLPTITEIDLADRLFGGNFGGPDTASR